MNKFEKDLKAFFPEIYELHSRVKNNKENWEALTSLADLIEKDRHIHQVVEELWKSLKTGTHGEVSIIYQQGRVNKIYRRESIEITSPK